jgi:DNA-binding NarL/FixJ family response regulator
MKRVLVICDGLLIGSGIESILSREDDLILMHSLLTTEIAFEKEIDTFKPDVIIIDDNLKTWDLSKLIRLLKRVPVFRLMILALNENRVQIFDKQDVLINQLADFVNEVRRYQT